MTSDQGATPDVDVAVERLLAGRLPDPHALLGPHVTGGTTVVRVFHPEATTASLAREAGVTPMGSRNGLGLFEVTVPVTDLPGYRIRFRNDEREWEQEDPYRFSPALGRSAE